MNNKFSKILYVSAISLLLVSCKQKNILSIRQEAIELYEDERYEEALTKFDEALKLGDGDIGNLQYDLILYEAECEYRIGNYKRARELYSVLLAVDKNNKKYQEMFDASSIYEKMFDAKVALDNNNLNEAEKLLNEIRNSGHENDKSYLFNEIILAEKRGLYEDAFSLIERYLKSFPNDEVVMKELEFVKTRLMPVKEPETEAPKESETAVQKNNTNNKKKKN